MPNVMMSDNLWKRIAIAATACVLFVVLASSFTPNTTTADRPRASPGDTPIEMAIPPTPVNAAPASERTSAPEQAIGDVARADADIIGTIEGKRYSVTIHAASEEPLYSVYDRRAGLEVASMLNADEVRASFPDLRDVQRALPTQTDRTQLMYVNPNDV